MKAHSDRSAIRLLLCLAFAVSTAGPGVARANAAEPQAERYTLHNGLRVIVVRNTLAPVVTTVMNYLAGSAEDPNGFTGTAHAQEHMMFRGSPGLSTDQLAELSAAMGGQFNADTQPTVTQYFFTLPAEDLNVALHIESIRMRGVLDTEQGWQQERGAIEQEVARDLSSPQYLLYTKLLKAAFRGTPYAYSGLGTDASFNTLTGAALRSFHRKWYAPNDAILVVVGDVQPQAVFHEAERLFGDIPARPLPPRPSVQYEPVKPETIRSNTDLAFGFAVAAYRLPGFNSPDYAALKVLERVLNSRRGSLYALVPEGKALAAGFSLQGLPNASLGYALAAFPQGADSAALLGQVRDVIAADVKNGFPAELVEAAKRREITAAELEKTSVSGLAMEWSRAVAVEGHASPEDELQAIQRVTVEDVNAAARKYLATPGVITAVLTPHPSGPPVAGAPPSKMESFTPAHTERVPLPEWAKAAVAKLKVPAPVVHPVVSTLPNGLTLLVQTVEHSGDAVRVIGHIRNEPDVEVPPGQEGVSSMLDQLLEYGTTSMDRLQFQKALDEIGASESAGADFEIASPAGRFDRAVQLLAENEMHPALPEKAFAILRPQLAAAAGGELQSANFLTTLSLENALYPKGDPAQRYATPASISKLSLADVQAYYRRAYRPDLTTIVVIGNISPEAARAAVARYFGGWTATGPKPPTELPPVPPNQPSTRLVPDASRVQDRVILAETLPMKRSDPDYYPLQLANHVLGGAFYATWLYRDLRENAGLVYTVSSSLEAGKTRAAYRVSYGCEPANVAKARAIVRRDLQQMASTLIEPEEFVQAKALLLRQIPLAEASETAIAAGLIYRINHDLPLNEPVLAARRYLQLTPTEVRSVFAKYVDPARLVEVVEGPAPAT